MQILFRALATVTAAIHTFAFFWFHAFFVSYYRKGHSGLREICCKTVYPCNPRFIRVSRLCQLRETFNSWALLRTLSLLDRTAP